MRRTTPMMQSTAVAGVLVPGPQQEAGLYRGLNSGAGYLVDGPRMSPARGGITGVDDVPAAWLQKNAPLVRLRPDHRVIVQRVWPDERQRLSGVTSIVSSLAKLAA